VKEKLPKEEINIYMVGKFSQSITRLGNYFNTLVVAFFTFYEAEKRTTTPTKLLLISALSVLVMVAAVHINNGAEKYLFGGLLLIRNYNH
jgi:hypothetical protein